MSRSICRMSFAIVFAAALVAVTAWTSSTQAAIVMFTMGGSDNFGTAIDVDFTLEEVGGDVKFTITVDPAGPNNTGNIADLRGIFMHISDETLLSNITATGADVTDQQYSANNVINLGNGANLNGDGTQSFDLGVEIGSSGIGGGDDFQTTMFTLSHSTETLTIANFIFDGTEFGVRATSTGPAGGSRGGSSKLVGPPDITTVPAPAALPTGIALMGLFAAKRRRRA